MNKREMIEAVAKEANATRGAAEVVVSAALRVIAAAISRGESVQLVGFGTFSVAERKARQGRNPQTGAAMKIPAAKVVKFKAGSGLRVAANKGKRKK